MNERHAGRVYFVSGIDTGVGKTVATGLMARHLANRGIDAITVKMVQTGCDGFSEDLGEHRRLCGVSQLPEDCEGLTSPQVFKFPASPLLAARLEGASVDLGLIRSSVAECARRRDVVLVEGAGGLLVPLAGDVMSADFAAGEKWPLVLVTCGRLGSLNHTLLSLEAAASRGMRVAGVVYNWCPDADPTIDADTENEVRRGLRRLGFDAPVVRVPRLDGDIPDVDFSEIFR